MAQTRAQGEEVPLDHIGIQNQRRLVELVCGNELLDTGADGHLREGVGRGTGATGKVGYKSVHGHLQ